MAHAAPGAVDKTGWEKILIDPDSQKPIPAFAGFYVGYSVLAVYGPEARILALYAEDADHQGTDAERRGSKLIAGEARDQYTSMRKGPCIAAAMMGNGRVITVALPPWFDTIAKLHEPKRQTSLKRKTSKKSKGRAPLYEEIVGTDEVFLRNALLWLARGKHLDALRIATTEEPIATALKVGKPVLLRENDFAAQIGSVDVFVGRVDSLTLTQIDALIAFAKDGGGILTGGGPDRRADADSRAWYAYPVDDQLGLIASTDKINRLLRPAGLGIAYGIIDGKTSRQRFDTNIPVQWTREYKSILEAIEDLHLVRKGRDNTAARFRASPTFQPTKEQDPAVAVATLIGQQVFTMTQVFPDGAPIRDALNESLRFLKQPQPEPVAVRGPIQKGLCMHEAVTLFRSTPELMKKSKIADRFLGYPVTVKHMRTTGESLNLAPERDVIQITEFYAPPGELVTIDFRKAPQVVGKGCFIHINTENSYNFHSELNFLRPPLMQKAFPIDRPVVKVAHPYGGIIYIRYRSTKSDGTVTAENTGEGKASLAARDVAEAETMLADIAGRPKLTARISGAVRHPCFVSGKNDNADWRHQLDSYPGYKAAVICRNVWADIGRRHLGQFDLKDVETWALQFDASYGRATEVGPSVNTRTTRLTDICIPGREPGMPTRMGRMTSLRKAKVSVASVDAETGMTAHKVGHGLFGGKYAWARAIGTGTEFRANQMVWYEQYKRGASQGRGSQMSAIGVGKEAIPYHPYAPYGLIHAIGKFLSNPLNSYFSAKVDDAEMHADPRGKGSAHLPFLRAKWMYDFDGQQGVNVWAKMNKEFANDIRAENDGDPNTRPSYPVRKGDANLHAEDHAVRWARICGYNIIPYLEVFGFKISDQVKRQEVIREAKPWLPMASRYFNRAEQIRRNGLATFDFNRMDEKGMTAALSRNRKVIKPEFKGITAQPAHGTLKLAGNGIYNYRADKDFVGRDSFAYRVQHPDTKQECVFRVYIQVLGSMEFIEPGPALETLGRGALIEWFGTSQSDSAGGRRQRRRGNADKTLDLLSSLSNELLPTTSRLSLQRFETPKGGNGSVRMRAYLEVPRDGDCAFWVASSVASVLRLNATGPDPSKAVVILRTSEGRTIGRKTGTADATTAWLTYFDSKGKANKTAPLSLRGGTRCYVELSRASSAKGSLALAWSHEDGASVPDEVIPNRYLIPTGRPLSYMPVDDTAETKPGTPVTVDVLENDLDYRFRDSSNAECLQVSFVGQAANGKTEIVGDRRIRYVPKPGFIGTEKFQYAIQDKSFRDRMRVGSVTVVVQGEPVGGMAPPAAMLIPGQ